ARARGPQILDRSFVHQPSGRTRKAGAAGARFASPAASQRARSAAARRVRDGVVSVRRVQAGRRRAHFLAALLRALLCAGLWRAGAKRARSGATRRATLAATTEVRA